MSHSSEGLVRSRTVIACVVVTAVLGGVAVLMPHRPGSSVARPPVPDLDPKLLRLNGVMRDFHKGDATFAVAPSGGNGHSAGSVMLGVDSAGRPAYSGLGRKVNTEWKDSANRPIAPHLYAFGAGGPNTISVTQTTLPPSKGKFDSWDSSKGPYGGNNVGPAPTFVVDSALAAIAVPLDLSLLPNQGDVDQSGTTVNQSFHCNKLNWNGTLTIDGQISILCEEKMMMGTQTIVNLAPNSTLAIYLRKGSGEWNHVDLNVNTKQPWRVQIFNMGTEEVMVHNHAQVYAYYYSPTANLSLTNHGALFGRFSGKTINFGVWGHMHNDAGAPLTLCNQALKDKLGAWGSSSNGGIPSQDAFADWFRDAPGKNMSSHYVVDLVKVGSVFEYLDNNFHPVDGQLFGEESEAHNNYYTYAVDATFEYDACAGQFFEFKGNDDAWVFVNGVLAMDLGGLSPGVEQYIDIDRLGLVDGRMYSFKFFFAQRNSQANVFRVRTNINLITQDVAPTISAGYD